MNRKLALFTSLALSFGLSACGGDDDPTPDAGSGGQTDASTEDASTQDASTADASTPTESTESTVVSSDQSAWVYFKIESQETVEASESWDLAFSRTLIQTNSSTTAPKTYGGALELPEGTDFDAVSSAPTVGYSVDEAMTMPGPSGTTYRGNPALQDWYDYDMSTHAVTAKDTAYLIRTADGKYAKLKITSWDGDSGTYTLQVAMVDRAMQVHTTEIEATDSSEWVYFSFRMGTPVTVTEASTDLSWDLSSMRYKMGTNSGVSGAGEGGGIDPDVVELADVAAPAEDATWTVDTMMTPAMGGAEYPGNTVIGAWWDYDMSTHQVSAFDKAYLLRTADGGLVRLKFKEYSSGVTTIDWSYAGAGRDEF